MTGILLVAGAAGARAQDTPSAVRDPAALGVSVGSGARAWGMGGAFIAVADDGSAASWNPAGIAVLEKPEVSVVWKARDRQVFDRSPFTFQSIYGGGRNLVDQEGASAREELSSRAFDLVSAAYPMTFGSVKVVPQLSYQRAIDQGQRTETLIPTTTFSKTFIAGITTGEDRDFGVEESEEITGRTEQSGGLDVWSASVGVRPVPALSVGISLNWWRNGSVASAFEEKRRTVCQGEPGNVINETCEEQFDTSNTATATRFSGFNVNLGLLWRVGKRVRIGAVFKTPFDMQHEEEDSGSGLFALERSDYEPPPSFLAGVPTTRTSDVSRAVATETERGTVRWPRTIGVGVAFNPRPELTLSSDFTTTAWSGAVWERTLTFRNFGISPFQSQIDFEDTSTVRWPTFLPLEDSPGLEEFPESLRDQYDTYQARLGTEYVLTRRRFVVPLRAGAFLDRQYFSNGRGDPVHAWGWTVGAGLVWSFVGLDVAYVRQSTSYSLDLDFSTPDDGGRVEQQRSVRDDHIGADRIYISGVIRF
jgi:long-subunit fatty acid transport protein